MRAITDRGTLCERCEVAKGPWTRMRGLLGRRRLEPGTGLWLRPTFSIHTMFMRFPIDAVFLDRDLQVVGMRPRLAPWRAATMRGARSVLELAAGETERHGLAAGDRVTIEEVG